MPPKGKPTSSHSSAPAEAETKKQEVSVEQQETADAEKKSVKQDQK